MLTIIRSVEDSSKIRLLTIEFEIICAAFEKNEQSAGELFLKVRSSSSSFYYALRLLSDKNVLIKTADSDDRRISRYSVNKKFKEKMLTTLNEIQNLNFLDL
jgi:DNA-binding MarR family transcriptional regulator